MKKNIIIMLVVSAIIWCGCIFQSIELKNAASSAAGALAQTKNAFSGGFRSAETEFIKYSDEWKKHETMLSLSVSHDDLDAIALHNARLGACIESGNEAEALAVIGELCEIFNLLENGFRINPQNIL